MPGIVCVKTTKKDMLKQWMRQMRVFSTHEVVSWGLRNYCISADRIKRMLRADGLVRKLTKEEKVLMGFRNKDAVYEYIGG